jgi:predicted transcriptional regulator
MAAIKVSSKVEEAVWEQLREYASETDRTLSRVLTEAIGEYLERRLVRPQVLRRLEASIAENRELGKLLAH